MEKEESKEKPKKGNKKKNSTVLVNVSNTRFSIVRLSVESMGYKITESTTKPLLFWCDSGGSFEFVSQLSQWQFYNHFPGTWAIARKVDLARNIEKMARLLPEYYNFHPKSFIIPSQFTEMESYMNSISKKKSRRTFIVKPDRGSFGKGIILIQDPEAITDYIESAIAQQYIEPYLIDGLKFDLRIYALVSSIEPLRIYLFNEGIGRFCTELYEKPNSSNLELSYAHLTNYALNKTNPNFQQPTDADHADTGHKRSLTCILEHMRSEGIDTNDLLSSIEDIIRLTVISIQPYLSTNYKAAIPSVNDKKSRCFEILGFDILIDKKLKPWLLEVNWSPSLATESPFDKVLKKNVITDTLKIINIPHNFKQLVMKRKKAISLRRTISKDSMDDIDNLWDPDTESKISEQTGWKLIYPISDDHPKHEMAEISLAVSKASPVGASVSVSQARILKETIISQIKEKNPQFKQTPQISEKPKNVQFSETFSMQTNLNTSVRQVTTKRHLLNQATQKITAQTATHHITSPHQPPQPGEHFQRVQRQSQRSQRLSNDSLFQMKIQKTSSSTVVPKATFPSELPPATASHTADLVPFSGENINEVEERKRKASLRKQSILAQSLGIPSICARICVTRERRVPQKVDGGEVKSEKKIEPAVTSAQIHVPKPPPLFARSMPESLVRGEVMCMASKSGAGEIVGGGGVRHSIVKATTNQSIFKPMMIVQKQTMFY